MPLQPPGGGGLPASHATDAGTHTNLPYAPLNLLAEFEISGLTKVLSHTGFDTFTQSSARYLAFQRQSSGTQNDEAVFILPTALMGGTWTLALAHTTTTDAGIMTIATSPDNSAWTDRTTIDQYSGSLVAAVRTEVTGLALPAGIKYLRLKMATKNVSSSAYAGRLSSIHGIRTGA